MALLPASLFELGARVAVGAVVWMGFWWITVPVSPAVTAFVPIVVNALFGVLPMGGVISNYFSEIVVLLFGCGIAGDCLGRWRGRRPPCWLLCGRCLSNGCQA